jgi:hypothetical protein
MARMLRFKLNVCTLIDTVLTSIKLGKMYITETQHHGNMTVSVNGEIGPLSSWHIQIPSIAGQS